MKKHSFLITFLICIVLLSGCQNSAVRTGLTDPEALSAETESDATLAESESSSVPAETESCQTLPQTKPPTLKEQMDLMAGEQLLTNALSYEDGRNHPQTTEAIIQLCTSESGKYTAYGFITPEYGMCGILINNVIDGEDNWNTFPQSWAYGNEKPQLTEQGDYDVVFSFFQTPEQTQVWYLETFDTGTMTVRD